MDEAFGHFMTNSQFVLRAHELHPACTTAHVVNLNVYKCSCKAGMVIVCFEVVLLHNH
jgi:hypothetical protein